VATVAVAGEVATEPSAKRARSTTNKKAKGKTNNSKEKAKRGPIKMKEATGGLADTAVGVAIITKTDKRAKTP
jgi:hypothetical protein